MPLKISAPHQYFPLSARDGQKYAHGSLHKFHRPIKLHSGCQLCRCERRQGASPRSWQPRLQEQQLWSARGEAGAAARKGRLRAHGIASRLGNGRGRMPGWDVELGCVQLPREACAVGQEKPWCRDATSALAVCSGMSRGSSLAAFAFLRSVAHGSRAQRHSKAPHLHL